MVDAAVHPKGSTFASRLRQFGERPAIVTESGERLSYDGLAGRVEAFAERLGPERRLLLVEAANSLEPVIAYLAALAGGHVVILTAEATPRLLEQFRPDALFRVREGEWSLELSGPEGGLHPDLALLLSTSGTTGATKLVRLSAAAVDANAASIAEYLGTGPGTRALTTLPIHYSYGLSVLNSHLAVGGTLLLTGRSLLEAELWDFFEREAGTSLAGVPYSYELLDRTGFWGREHPHLTTLTQAGGRLPAETAARVEKWARERSVRFFVMYGQTEATARIAYMPPERLADAPDCIGIAIPGGRLELKGEGGHPVETPETEGELVYRGPNVMMGYALARGDLADGAEIEALATGDLAVRRADGLYRITGRTSRIAKPFGLRVSLDEVERELGRRGLSAAVTGSDSLLAVAVTPKAPAGLAADLAGSFSLPESLFDISDWPELPRLPSGKTDYRRILAEAEARQADAAQEPATVGESAVRAAFRRTFQGRAVEADSSFVGLGGDSLSYVQLSLALEEALGGDLPAGWEQLPVSRLEALARPGKGRGLFPRIDSEMVLRALALLAVIVNHASDFPVGGGSDVLMLLAGYSLARFQSDRFIAGGGVGIVRDFFARVVLPYLVILILYALTRKPVDWASFLLIGNYFPSPGGFLTPFWFIEALFQLYLIVLLLFLVPAVRRQAGSDPFRLGLWFAAGAFLLKFGAMVTIDRVGGFDHRTAHAALPLFAIGWLIWFARTGRQKWITAAIVAGLALLTMGVVPMFAIWGEFSPIVGEMRTLWLIAAAALLLAFPRLPVPAPLHNLITQISAAGYQIYLSHGVVIYAGLVLWPQIPVVVIVALAILLGLALNRAINLMRFPFRRAG
ncbi:AMP-binding protein [Sandaracinobacter sp. RS1-74]|uniref:AMP-binding protein n=1 Tax=Sandaracinobacteroides sayramensis TaxID=2913411 RepID=UPI001EDC80A6|nr:AMP-binding protein [Sandaracinobacteroides sayramensis]MCG2839405.1 AMP-binding protein [Sandaracinobacteroides sayramensis]